MCTVLIYYNQSILLQMVRIHSVDWKLSQTSELRTNNSTEHKIRDDFFVAITV